MPPPFQDRRDAGRQLATDLAGYAGRNDVLVLGLPRGGVPVAYEVAVSLGTPLDVFLVRKLGVPGHEELAMGAIATGGVRVLNHDVIEDWHISPAVIDAVAVAEERELTRRERLYRGARPAPVVSGQTVILVDDGLATGSTMRAAAEALRRQAPARLVVAVPVAAAAVCGAFDDVVDETICGATPEPFYAVGLWYQDFSPTSDDEVRQLLGAAEARPSLQGQRDDHVPASYPIDAAPDRRTAPARSIANSLWDLALPLAGNARDFDPLLDLIGEARFVLIGEATHGTEEFYRIRAEITKRLIVERRFSAVAAEADWPDAFRVNRYLRGRSDDASPDEALADFTRFPQWMLRNTVVRDFVGWLRSYNDELPPNVPGAGFYGLDLYSLHASIAAVIDYLDKVDPAAARRARSRYACFDHFGDDAQAYGYTTSLGAAEACEDEVVNQLLELQGRAAELAQRDGRVAEDEFFSAAQNARLARNAEQYYRAMFRGRVSSWNLRDRHMVETLDALAVHLDRAGPPSRIVVWAHNSHIGDARATAMGEGGEWNVGQLTRERYGEDVVLIGFSTDHGTVAAASDWGMPVERKRVRPGLPGSYEALFHEIDGPNFMLLLRGGDDLLRQPRLQRAIGVVYRPETERFSHYFHTRLADQFDAMLHIDETGAVEPLEQSAAWEIAAPETYPFGE